MQGVSHRKFGIYAEITTADGTKLPDSPFGAEENAEIAETS